LVTIPLAWWAAWNITPSRTILYPFARAVIVFCRSLPTLMLGLLLVAIFVFGPFAGVLALVIGTIGFAGKLMAEVAEAIDMGPVEALRSTGAGPLMVFIFAILPQVKPAWSGIIIYNWDARLRSSTILGFVGAGGIGLHLREQISILEYHAALGIITIIVVLVIISEVISHFLRQWLR
jgi:phosphonate transport system permease protein